MGDTTLHDDLTENPELLRPLRDLLVNLFTCLSGRKNPRAISVLGKWYCLNVKGSTKDYVYSDIPFLFQPHMTGDATSTKLHEEFTYGLYSGRANFSASNSIQFA